MTHAPSSLRRRRTVVASLLGAALALSVGVTAQAAPPEQAGKPDRGRDSYVSLGDSFSAGNGTGLPDLDPACHRSSLAYPSLVAEQRPDTTAVLLACSGATTRTVLDTQVQALDRQTDFVTLSVGGNDLGFATVAGVCVAGTEPQCLGAVAQADALARTVLPDRLDETYDAVRARVRRAEVVVVGYPRFFAEAYVPCAQSQGVTATEAAALNGLVETLDAVLAEQARAAGFTYLSVLDAFTGHDMCAPEPWVNGVLVANRLDAYHPTAAGHRDGYAPLVAEQLETRRPSVSTVQPR